MSTKRRIRKSVSTKSGADSPKCSIDGYRLVSVWAKRYPGMPRVRKTHVPRDTYFMVARKGGEIRQLTTITVGGVHIGWMSCGNCHMPYALCTCGNFTVPRSVEYICDQDQALADGEEWGVHHPNYKGSIRARIAQLNRRGDSLTASVSSIDTRPANDIETEYDKERLDRKVIGQSKRSLSEFKTMVGTSEGPQKKRLKGVSGGRKKRSLRSRS